ncbi:class I SAM-dependent methyltransferase [Actinomycetes bacterium KLBMP 9797]
MGEKTKPGLAGVPETLLWTLYHRAAEARRPDAVLTDPLAVELIDAIEYPFEDLFGADVAFRAQWQALRHRRFDHEVRRFLDRHPDGTVVALGEGLETQFWRVDNGRVRWVGVDLPEVIALRDRLLPASPRRTSVAGSVHDDDWFAAIDPSRGVLVTAQGLLMHLDRADAHRLIARCAERFPGGTLVFDVVTRWFSDLAERAVVRSRGYVAPAMPWGLNGQELDALRRVHPAIAEVRRLPWGRGRGALFGYVVPALERLPLARAALPIWILRTDFS